MLSDSPLTDPKLDAFRRWDFAQEVARLIVNYPNESSIAIGIYGAWGEGKTTVINYIEKALKDSSNSICVRFNPWLFRDEALLLQSFFHTLARQLEQSFSTPQAELGKLLEKYGDILSYLALKSGGNNSRLLPGEVAQETDIYFSSVELDKIRARIEEFLLIEARRIVISIDDLDRIQNNEIQSVFKLVKLSANFNYTAYVLAFDENMVAAVLDENYGYGNQETGRSFIEKIAQVSLPLPKADTLSLRELCITGVHEAIQQADIQLTEGQSKRFVKNFITGLEIRLQTHRRAKRYINALIFALTLLKNEVNIVDLMLIEGIRVFYPKLYYVIRQYPDIFVGLDLEMSSKYELSRNNEEVRQRSLKVLNEGLEELTANEREAAKNLLKDIFPGLRRRVFSDIDSMKDMEENPEWKWEQEQRIASKQYFSRFFSYTVTKGEISELELESFLRESENNSIPDIAAELKKLITKGSADKLVLKLIEQVKKLSPETSRKLALAVSQVGNSFSKAETLLSTTNFSSMFTAFAQAARLVKYLVENLYQREERFYLARDIAQEGEPLSFAFECFNWMRRSDEQGEQEEQKLNFSLEEEQEIGYILARRTKEYAETQSIFNLSSEEICLLLSIWTDWGSREEINQYIAKMLGENPENALKLLRSYQLIEKATFGRDTYKLITKVVDADTIYNALLNIDSLALETRLYENSDRSLDERLAYQFASIHQQQSQS
ncbi:MAG TPA: P-loop NTPase fold protein [Coleofasciculaceae cyanobacterium]|jgi:predicted KAP-like P-loop ATPase